VRLRHGHTQSVASASEIDGTRNVRTLAAQTHRGGL
jgi:hypothetical protein